MGRHRTIDRNAILDAAQRVVTRDGASRLTLDAVAIEAGVSKGSVLYDYRTKQALVEAVVARRVKAEQERHRAALAELGPVPDAILRAKLATVTAMGSPCDEDRSVAISLCATLAQDAELRAPIQTAYRKLVNEVAGTCTHPRGARLAFLAIEGLMLMEWFDLHHWSAEEREAVIADIGWLIGQDPERQPEARPAEGSEQAA